MFADGQTGTIGDRCNRSSSRNPGYVGFLDFGASASRPTKVESNSESVTAADRGCFQPVHANGQWREDEVCTQSGCSFGHRRGHVGAAVRRRHREPSRQTRRPAGRWHSGACAADMVRGRRRPDAESRRRNSRVWRTCGPASPLGNQERCGGSRTREASPRKAGNSCRIRKVGMAAR